MSKFLISIDEETAGKMKKETWTGGAKVLCLRSEEPRYDFKMFEEDGEIWIQIHEERNGVFVDAEIPLVQWLQNVDSTLDAVLEYLDRNSPRVLLSRIGEKLHKVGGLNVE